MQRFTFAVILLSSSLCGCTTLSLERHTLEQNTTLMDIRYRQVLENLALIASNPGNLPSYSNILTGVPQVNDMAQFGSTTTWANVSPAKGIGSQSGFGSEQISPMASRAVNESWTLFPVTSPEQLLAIKCSCKWVLSGEESARQDYPTLLDPPPTKKMGPSLSDRHFGVAAKLAQLQCGWLHVGTKCDFPHNAVYKAHCDGIWVWVTPEGMKGLSDFTAIIQEIALTQVNSPSLFYAAKADTVSVTVNQRANQDNQALWKFSVDRNNDNYGIPDVPYRARYDNLGTDAFIKSLINASTAH
jgi:hypothetical protein